MESRRDEGFWFPIVAFYAVIIFVSLSIPSCKQSIDVTATQGGPTPTDTPTATPCQLLASGAPCGNSFECCSHACVPVPSPPPGAAEATCQ